LFLVWLPSFEILEDRRKDQQQGINPLLKIVTVQKISLHPKATNHHSPVIPTAASFIAAEEPVLSEAEGISVSSTAARQPSRSPRPV
jgi:hypothetical protein